VIRKASELAQIIKLVNCIQEVPCSITGRDIDHPVKVLLTAFAQYIEWNSGILP